ncbi:hypothetical protein TH53_21580 [Pedobacter lusitanus]|uniref:HTH araC/xylS-type domain-containing protein n=1 Tax=Pedobacter lusitanus TaxID=1503925 RepID=A0A0D0FS60_9SPHI|nr:AraC family transcriptional regulator [Pedobacter lusitanus]KIO75289.1 hypothetical protein TH53_21580 [Pedobacter lusitanus]
MKAELIVDAPIVESRDIWVKKINKPYFDHPFHFHQVCELVWVDKGFGKFIIGDHIGNFSHGELILHGAGLPHLWQCDKAMYTNPDLFTKATTIYFSSAFIINLTDNPELVTITHELLRKAKRGLRILGNTRDLVINEIKKIEGSKGFQQLSHFLLILDLLSYSNEYEYLSGIRYENPATEFDLNRFTQVYQFAINNFHRDIMLTEIADLCNLTPNAFCRYFKSKTQKTFSRFMNELRIGHACKLLQDENNTIDSICYSCGYNSQVNFFKFFKLIMNKTPGEYRQRITKIQRNL